jgi:3'(2'),5'-bisphosphate nucleotidase
MILSKHDAQHIINGVIKAGALIAEYAASRQIGEVIDKADGTPATVVDRMAEDIIVHSLNELKLDVPIIAEERFSEGECQPLRGDRTFWLIDALDGTKEFIAGTGQYTVNIALIKGGQPVWGVIYAPEKRKLYCGEQEQGSFAFFVDDKGQPHEKRRCRVRALDKGVTLATGSPKRTYLLNNLYGDYVIEKRIRTGSSIKFCMIAEGEADIYPRMGPTSEWDTAAADIILREAGGLIIDLDCNKPLSYGNEERRFLNPYFVALSRDLYQGDVSFFADMKAQYLTLKRNAMT